MHSEYLNISIYDWRSLCPWEPQSLWGSALLNDPSLKKNTVAYLLSVVQLSVITPTWGASLYCWALKNRFPVTFYLSSMVWACTFWVLPWWMSVFCALPFVSLCLYCQERYAPLKKPQKPTAPQEGEAAQAPARQEGKAPDLEEPLLFQSLCPARPERKQGSKRAPHSAPLKPRVA